MTERAAIAVTKTKSMFRQECSVAADISATPDGIWRLLTNLDDMVRWNSTLTSMEGSTDLDGTVRMVVPEAPGQVFAVRVTKLIPDREMVWTKGNRIMFLGVRTHRLTPGSNHTTRFEMSEVFSGLLLPLVAWQLPDFGPMFERYAADLKAEAEGR